MRDPVWAVTPCRECHPELHRSQCTQGGCAATPPTERLLFGYEESIVDLTLTIKRVRDLANRWRCCRAPHLCGGVCRDDAESATLADAAEAVLDALDPERVA